VIAGVLHGLGAGWTFPDAARFGVALAARTLGVLHSVDPSLSAALPDDFVKAS
jgi:sugar/nucleoside kinase (ribokinase family)